MARILYANDGLSSYDAFFLERLSERHEVILLSFSIPSGKASILPDGITVVGYPILKFLQRFPILGAPVVTSIPHAILLRRTVERLQPQIVIANEATSYGLYAALAGLKAYYLFVWGSDVLVAPKRSMVLRLAAKLALRRARRILVDSTIQKNASINLGASSARILIVPWYDSRETLGALIGSRERADVKRIIGLDDSDRVILSSRWHRKLYSIETLIQAVPLLVGKVSHLKFLVIGSGPETARLKTMAKKLGVGDSVIFTGQLSRPNVLKYTQVADVYVSTSLSDGTSASLLDAMTLGIPAVVTDIPANREWIVPGNNGLLFPPRNHEELAQQIMIVLSDGELRKNLIANAYATVTSRADWKKNSCAFDEVLDSMASKEVSSRETARTAATRNSMGLHPK